MPNVTIPSVATTQTLTGDNGTTTNVSFMTNNLNATTFFGGNGVGLRGNTYDPAGEAALVVDFSNAVEDVQFTLFDVDQSGTNWDDQIRVEAYDLAGNPIPITFTTTGSGHIVESNGANGVLQIEASNALAGGDDQSSIVVNIAGPVGSFRVFYEDGSTTTNNNGVIDLVDLSFTDALPGDGTVTGTSGNDVINDSYAGDLEGDFVDNNDAILTGDTGNDDLIFGLGGNDSILAGGGADEVYGGSGDDTIDGGAGNDILVGDQTTNSNGDDTITGGAGNDTIYGDTAGDTNAVAGATVFSWNTIPREDGLSVAGGVSGTTTNGDVRVTLSVEQEQNFTAATIEKTDALFNYNSVSDTSSIFLNGGAAANSSDATTVTLDFEGAEPGYADAVSNVSFGIFDLDRLGGQFRDQVIIRAYDIDGNLIPVTLTPGTGAPITTSVDANGIATATANATAGGTSAGQAAGFVRVDVAGPVARIEVDYNNIDPAFGNHAINIGDISLTSIPLDDASGGGDDSLEGGLGNDVIFGQTGSDTIGLNNTFGNDTIFGGEDAGNTDTDVLNGSALTEDVTVVLSAPETGSISNGSDTATFSQIEEIRTGSGDDSVTGSNGDDVIDLGQGTDTINAGAGNDTINLGEDSPGTPDQDADVIILENGFDQDTVTGFDAPTANPDGTFAGIDTLDVTTLTDADGAPVNTNDVVVSDDGSGNAVLTFANGDSLTLLGVPAADAANPLYLNAIGIPLPPADGIVTGTQGNDVIDAAYAGDVEGDMVDASDALVAGEAPNDDIIVAQGGDDSISAGAGNDDIFGGDGDDSIDAGAGDDTVYGDTPGGAWFFEYYDLDPTSDASNLAQSGFANNTADFEGTPTSVGYTDSFNPDLIDPDNDFALKFSSIIDITTAGDYIFETTSNDGSKLFIDGVEVVNNDGEHAPTSVTGLPINLSAGEHLIEIIFFENEGTSFLTSSLSGPDTGGTAVDLASYSGLRPATGADTIAAGAGNDTLFGGGDDDLILIDENDDTDTISGGEDADGLDIDTVSFDSVATTDGVNVSFTGDETADYQVGVSGSDGTFTEIERVVGTDNADNVDLSGDSAGITVEAGAGDDTLTSGQGDDVLQGGTGDDLVNIDQADGTDTITGGENAGDTDVDTVSFAAVSNSDGVNVSFTGDEAADYLVGTNGSDGDFTQIERVVGTANADTVDLSGDSTGITVESGAGDDVVTSGDGDDVIATGAGQDDIVINDGFGNDAVDGGDTLDDTGDVLDGSTLSEDVVVDFSAAETGTVTNGTDVLTFDEIEEIITGSGDDTVLGGAGNDRVSTGAGNDTISGGAGNDSFAAGAGDDTINGGAGDDTILGGAGQDDILIDDNFGNDTVDGGNTLDGTGDVLDGSSLTQDVTVDFSAAETGVITNGGDTLTFAEIEAFFTGSGNDTVLGDAGDDVVSTGAGTDTISGGAGDDTFDAGAGDDTIDGGIGADSITAGTGNDTVQINDNFGADTIDGGSDLGDGDKDTLDGSGLTEDVVVNLSTPETGTISNGTDTASFSEIEEVVTGTGDDTVFGGSGSDTVSTGGGEDEVTFGYGDDIDTGDGDDTLVLATQGPASNGGIFIKGGNEERDVNGDLIGDGDTLNLGTLADLSTLSTTTDPDGSLSGTVELDDGTLLTFSDIERIICFTPGTTIATPYGARAIETLKVGDLVMTRDHGLQPIRWIQSRTVAAEGKFAPVRMRPGAVVGLETDLLVSPQHRMLFTGYRAELLFGEREVLMPALHLVDDKLVTRETGGDVTYIHMMFDNHEVIYADGAASESFHPGDDSLNGITGPAREELFALFPELRSNVAGYGPAARRCLKKHETQMLQVS